MTNQEVAKLLSNVAVAYSILDENKYKFQIIAYQRAAESISKLNNEFSSYLQKENKEKIPGIGNGIMAHLKELFRSGKVKHFESVLKKIPSSVFVLLNIPTFGPKKAYKLVKILKINNPKSAIQDIKKAAESGKIAKIPSFGEKSQEDILRALKEYSKGGEKNNKMILPYAFALASSIISYLKKSPLVITAETLGSLRRMKETIGDVDIAVSSDKSKSIIAYFTEYPNKERVVEQGEKTASIVAGGRQIDLMVQTPKSFGSLLQHFTGSKEHNIKLREYALKKGLSISEYGIKNLKTGKIKNFTDEKGVYNYLGLDDIPPELREGKNEIELAKTHTLPKLLELNNIKGDLHIHSNYNIEPSHDLGTNDYETLIKKAIELKYEYIGFSEHNPSISKHNKDQIYSILLRRNKIIEQIKKSIKNIRIINLLEIDILSSGELPIDNRSLSLIDAAIVSIHSAFHQEKEIMTKRILKGLSYPKVKILAHPTGRLVNKRSGYEADWEKIFKYASENSKALEINSWPERLDLPSALVEEAKNYGVKFVINTDAHETSQMKNMFFGVSVARRAACSKKDILNTLPYEDFISWIRT